MTNNLEEIISKVDEVANKIQSKYLLEILKEVKNSRVSGGKLRLTVVGQHFSKMDKVVSETFLDSKHDFSYIHNKMQSYKLKLVYSDAEVYKVSDNHVEFSNVSKENFYEYFNEAAENVKYAEVGLNDVSLEKLELILICSKNSFEDIDWIETLVGTDYLVMILRADSILSMCEKELFNGFIKKFVGFDRCCLLITNIDKIDEQEVPQIENYIKKYLSGIQSNTPYYFCKEDTTSHIKDSINQVLRQADGLHSKYIKKVKEVCISEAVSELLEFKNKTSVSKENINDAIKVLENQKSYLNNKILARQKDIELFINGGLKSNFLDKISRFNEEVKLRIKTDILEAEDTEEVRNSIPKYFEYVWEKFFNEQQQWLKSQLATEISEISKTMQSDILTCMGELDEGIRLMISDAMRNNQLFKIYMPKKANKNEISDLSKIMNIAAIGIAFFSIPIALLTFGSSQLLKFSFRKDIKKGEKIALVDSVNDSSDKVKMKLGEQVNIEFAEITESLKQQTKTAYNEIINQIIGTLQNEVVKMENASQLLDYIDSTSKNLKGMIVDEC